MRETARVGKMRYSSQNQNTHCTWYFEYTLPALEPMCFQQQSFQPSQGRCRLCYQIYYLLCVLFCSLL